MYEDELEDMIDIEEQAVQMQHSEIKEEDEDWEE